METDLKKLLKELDSSKKKVRLTALRKIKQLSPDRLLAFAALESSHFRRSSVRDLISVTLSGAIVLSLILYLYAPEMTFSIPRAFLFFIPILILYFWWVTRGTLSTTARRELSKAIAEATDRTFIPVILTILQSQSGVQQTLREVLKCLLPMLRIGDADGWTKEQKQTLVAMLEKPLADVELTLCILKALEQVGDETAIPAVTKLSQLTTENHAGRRLIQQAAEACLPYLELRSQERQHRYTLLRASEPATRNAENELLRAAEASLPDARAEQLLRPHGSE